jgi:hypothetical protein
MGEKRSQRASARLMGRVTHKGLPVAGSPARPCSSLRLMAQEHVPGRYMAPRSQAGVLSDDARWKVREKEAAERWSAPLLRLVRQRERGCCASTEVRQGERYNHRRGVHDVYQPGCFTAPGRHA